MGELRPVAQAHEASDEIEPAAAIRLFDLPIQQVAGDLPASLAGSWVNEPLTEMCGQGVEVEVEAVAGKDRQAAWSQDLRQGMNEGICQVLGARAELKRGDEFGGGVKSHPHPYVVRLVPQGRVQLIQCTWPRVKFWKK